MKRRDLCRRTFAFAVDVVVFCKGLMASRCDAPIELVRQLLRAGTSVGANMEEAQCAQSRADLISKCSIACKEARESLYWLRLIHRTSDAPQAELDALISEADQLVSIITACIKNLKAL